MKRSLLIAIAVLLIAALFVGCNADKIEEDQLVEVSVSNDISRALDLVAETNLVDVDTIYWYYTAEKKDGYFATGETSELTPVKEGLGLLTDKLGATGLFSKGDWEFNFYGYKNPFGTENNTLYYSAKTTVTLLRKLSLSLALKVENAPVSCLYLDDVTFTYTGPAAIWTDYTSVRLFVLVDGEVFGSEEGYVGEKSGNTATFGAETLISNNIPAGSHDISFIVKGYYLENNVQKAEVIGELPSTASLIVDGMKYTVTNNATTPGVDEKDNYGEIEIVDPVFPKKSVETQALSTTAEVTINTQNTPSSAGSTTIEFPAGSFSQAGDAELTVYSYTAEAASAAFVVDDGTAAIAGLDLSLALGDTPISLFNGKEVLITTYIPTGLSGVNVIYNGDGAQPDNVQYNSVTGELSFTTTHFSTFIVVSNAAVASIGNVIYETFEAAVAAVQAGETITLINDYTVSAEKTTTADRIVIDKAITINFGTHTLSVPGELELTDNWCALYIDGDTTINATTGGIDCLDKTDGECGVYALNVRTGATLTINGGSYHGGGTIVQATLGRVVINGGEFSASAFEDPYGFDFVLNCFDAAYQAGTASFEVKGGSFYSFNPADNAAEGAHTNFVAPGFVSVEEGDCWKVVPSV